MGGQFLLGGEGNPGQNFDLHHALAFSSARWQPAGKQQNLNKSLDRTPPIGATQQKVERPTAKDFSGGVPKFQAQLGESAIGGLSGQPLSAEWTCTLRFAANPKDIAGSIRLCVVGFLGPLLNVHRLFLSHAWVPKESLAEMLSWMDLFQT